MTKKEQQKEKLMGGKNDFSFGGIFYEGVCGNVSPA